MDGEPEPRSCSVLSAMKSYDVILMAMEMPLKGFLSRGQHSEIYALKRLAILANTRQIKWGKSGVGEIFGRLFWWFRLKRFVTCTGVLRVELRCSGCV